MQNATDELTWAVGFKRYNSSVFANGNAIATIIQLHRPFHPVNADDRPILPVIFSTAVNPENANQTVICLATKGSFRR